MRVDRKYLPYMAASIWLAVGLSLMIQGLLWWEKSFGWSLSLLYFFLLSPFSFWFAFKILAKISQKNLRHIQKLPFKVCLFAFQPLRSYFIMFSMILLGLFLRRASLPFPYLGGLYLFMGLSLSVASVFFFKSNNV